MSKAMAALLDFVPEPMVIVSADAIIVSANKAFAALCETPVDRLKGQSLLTFAGAPESRISEMLDRCCRTTTPLPFAVDFRDSKGHVHCRVQGAVLEHGESKSSSTICLRVIPHSASTRHFRQLNEEISALKREILARRQTEEALRRSEAEMLDFFESASVGLHWVGPDGIILRANRAELQMLGYSREEYIGRPIADFHVDPPVIQDILTRLTRGEVLEEYPARLRCKDGSVRHVLINSSALFEGNTFKHTRCFTSDVTEKKLAEAALCASEARYRELIHNLPAAVYTCDREGRITLYNEAAANLWGRHPEIGNDLWCGSWKIYRPDGTPLPLAECPMARTLAEGRAVRGEEIIIERPDGARRHVLPHPEPVRDESGAVAGAINMLVDITERKQAEQAIANLAAIVTSSDDAIIGKNLRGIVTTWNRAAERLFGYSAEDMIGQSITRLIPPDRQNEEPDILERLARGEPIHHYETIRRRKDGTDVHVSLSVSPVIDAQGRVIGASKIARDITEQKRVEATLRERDQALTAANEELSRQTLALAEANKELEQFSYSVSHDLRAPLRTIDAFSRIVLEDHGGHLHAEAQRCLNIVRKAAGQAGELIDDLLEFSRLGRQSMRFASVPMGTLVQEAADDLQMMLKERTIELRVADVPPSHGDSRLLKLVWANVLSNAFKYTQYRTQAIIEVGWMPDDLNADHITYYVKDNGVGFDMRYVQKLFGVFQRLHRKEEFEGTGVGLAIVQRIVHRHGGRVWAEGKVDGGATFYFSLRKAMT